MSRSVGSAGYVHLLCLCLCWRRAFLFFRVWDVGVLLPLLLCDLMDILYVRAEEKPVRSRCCFSRIFFTI